MGHLKKIKCIAELVRNRENAQIPKKTGKHESRKVIKHDTEGRGHLLISGVSELLV